MQIRGKFFSSPLKISRVCAAVKRKAAAMEASAHMGFGIRHASQFGVVRGSFIRFSSPVEPPTWARRGGVSTSGLERTCRYASRPFPSGFTLSGVWLRAYTKWHNSAVTPSFTKIPRNCRSLSYQQDEGCVYQWTLQGFSETEIGFLQTSLRR